MKPIQMVVLGVALIAAVGLALIARNMITPEPVAVADQPIIEQVPETEVLVANEPVPVGNALTPERLVWEKWPDNLVREGVITRAMEPDALEKYAEYIARAQFYGGEPIRLEKLVQSDSGYLSAILPAGKRALAVLVAAESTAGGFILPNDHVDILMPSEGSAETILKNIRVLAIDQTIQEVDGESTRVGETATLELTPAQAEILTAARGPSSTGAVILALRSVEDSGGDSSTEWEGDDKTTSGNMRLIRGGQIKTIRVNDTTRALGQTQKPTTPAISRSPANPTEPAADSTSNDPPLLLPPTDDEVDTQ